MIKQTEHQVECPKCNWWINKIDRSIIAYGPETSNLRYCKKCNFMIDLDELKNDVINPTITQDDLNEQAKRNKEQTKFVDNLSMVKTNAKFKNDSDVYFCCETCFSVHTVESFK